MRTSLPAPRLEVDCHGERVATYQTVRGASLAVRRLRDSGFPVDVVRVQPSGLSSVDSALVDVPPRPRRNRALVVAGVVAVAVPVVLDGLTVVSLAAALAAAFLAALAFETADGGYLRALSRRVDHANKLVRAEEFEVLCSKRADEANHILATWWDSSAPPSPRRRASRRDEHRHLARVA